MKKRRWNTAFISNNMAFQNLVIWNQSIGSLCLYNALIAFLIAVTSLLTALLHPLLHLWRLASNNSKVVLNCISEDHKCICRKMWMIIHFPVMSNLPHGIVEGTHGKTHLPSLSGTLSAIITAVLKGDLFHCWWHDCLPLTGAIGEHGWGTQGKSKKNGPTPLSLVHMP